MNKRKNRQIVECAEMLVKKLHQSKYRTLNGEFSTPVKVEIERMIKHCSS